MILLRIGDLEIGVTVLDGYRAAAVVAVQLARWTRGAPIRREGIRAEAEARLAALREGDARALALEAARRACRIGDDPVRVDDDGDFWVGTKPFEAAAVRRDAHAGVDLALPEDISHGGRLPAAFALLTFAVVENVCEVDEIAWLEKRLAR